MADVFLSHAHPDRAVAAALAAALGAAGFSAAIEAAGLPLAGDLREHLLKEVEEARLVLVLWSEQAAGSAWVRDQVRLALEAWAAGRLLLVRLDASTLPLGLRDIDRLDVPDAAQAAGVARIVDAVRDRLPKAVAYPPAAAHEREAPPAPLPPPLSAPSPAGRRIAPTALALLLVSVLGLLAYAVLWSPLPYPSQPFPAPPPPATEPPLPAPDAGGPPPPAAVAPQPPAATYQLVPVIGLVVVAAGLVVVVAVWLRRRRSPGRAPMPAQAPGATGTPAPRKAVLFVSYSRDDGAEVAGLVAALEQSGLSTWLDTRHGGGERFAGPIVEAIRGARACAFMCSASAYASDHVARELYLADKYRKRLIPVEIEPATPSADFEYFFSGLNVVPAKPAEQCVQAIMQRLDGPSRGPAGSRDREAIAGRGQAA